MTSSADIERRRSDNFAVTLLTLGLVFLIALAGWWVSDELARARILRENLHTDYQQRFQIQRVFSLLQDAETATRGYSITGRSEFLGPYRSAVVALPGEIEKLRRAYLAEPEQLVDTVELRDLAGQRLAVLAESIHVRQTEGLPGIERVSATGRGKVIMDQIRAVVARMIGREEGEITSSLEEDRARSTRTESIVAALFGSLIFGSAAAILLTRRYLSARAAMLAAAEAEAQRQRAVFDAAMDGIVILDDQGRIERMNPAAERIFRRSSASVIGGSLQPLLDKASFAETERLRTGRRKGGGEAVRHEVAGVRGDGSTFPLEISIAGIGSGPAGGDMAFVRDIAERAEIDRMKDEFVSTVSHELRTPLTSIAGSLGLIAGGAAGPLPEKAARLIAIAQSNSQRLVRLINDVLDMEKLESGKMPFLFGPLDLAEVAARAVDGVRGYADQLGVELALDAPVKAPIRGDPDRLVQVATNLLSNAAKFSPRGETVRLSVKVEGETAHMSVTDKGPGVPEAFRDRIFTRFAQADASDARGKSGTGLGLYIAKEIAERHGGRLWFESPPTGGAVFHMDLPLQIDLPASSGARDRVLLVEDEPAAQALLTAILEHEGLKVDAAGTLKEAREALTDAGRYGAMVLDLRLPDGDGMDLLGEIRARPDIKGVPIVVVSADAQRGRDAGARDFDVVDWMEKPVDPDRLAELVRGAIGPGTPGEAVILHVDDDRDIREIVATALSGSAEILSADGVVQARHMLASRRPDLVILDLELRDGSGLDLLNDIRAEPGPPIPVVVFSAQDTGDLGRDVTATLVKSRTSLAGLVGRVRALMRSEGVVP